MDITTGSITKISNIERVFGSWTVFDVFDDHVVAAFSAPNQPHTLMIAKIPPAGQENSIDWTAIEATDLTVVKKNLLEFSWRITAFKRTGNDGLKIAVRPKC